jgi:hypothetical protein
VINTESRYIAEYPYCGAFQPPPESGLEPTENDWAAGVIVNPFVTVQAFVKQLCSLEAVDLSTITPFSNAR